MLSGDQNMIELNATVHYRLSHPEDFLFRQLDGEATIRAAAEITAGVFRQFWLPQIADFLLIYNSANPVGFPSQ